MTQHRERTSPGECVNKPFRPPFCKCLDSGGCGVCSAGDGAAAKEGVESRSWEGEVNVGLPLDRSCSWWR